MLGEIISSTGVSGTVVTWKINGFLNLHNGDITSDRFTHVSHVFQLRIFPKGDAWFEALTLQFFSMKLIGLGVSKLRTSDNLTNRNTIEYTMGIKRADSSEFRNEIARSDSVGSTPVHKLISRRNLELQESNLVPGGTLTVFCNIRYAKMKSTVNVGDPTTSTYDGASELIKSLKDVYLSQRYTDVKIMVKDKEFLAHKVILCSQSEVFAAMFEHDTAEKRSGVVTITDSDPESFECFLLYLYTGKLDTVSSVDVESLYKIADKYDLKGLKKECIGYIMKGMTVDSFFDIFHLASLHDESDLLSGATNFFIDNATVIMTTKKWLTMLVEHASLCNGLLLKLATRVIQK